MTSPVLAITGGSSGLGLALARTAWDNGYSLALLSRGKLALEEAGREFPDRGAQKCSIHSVDLVEERETQKAFSEASEVHGEIYGLVNNAATWTGGSPVRDLPSQDLRRALDLNLFSAFHATQAFLSLPAAQLPHRAIVNVGATSSLRGGENVFSFSAGKMALRALSMSLAKEGWKEGIHVSHIVIDGMLDNERTRNLNPRLPAHRFLDQKSVASTILRAIEQEPSCWTFEWDVRNQNATW